MAFMKEMTIYEGKGTIVYINECHRNVTGYRTIRKTRLFAVRRDDKTGMAHLLGLIKFDGAWRQYVFCPESGTKWSSGCMQGINSFCDDQTIKWRKGHGNKKNKNK